MGLPCGGEAIETFNLEGSKEAVHYETPLQSYLRKPAHTHTQSLLWIPNKIVHLLLQPCIQMKTRRIPVQLQSLLRLASPRALLAALQAVC